MSASAVLPIDTKKIRTIILAASRPVHLNQLTRTVITECLWEDAALPIFSPSNHYVIGDMLRIESNRAEVVTVEQGINPIQGSFSIVTLSLNDGAIRRMAAGVSGTKPSDVIFTSGIDEASIEAASRKYGARLRGEIQQALNADPRFRCVRTSQGDHWCLVELLPPIDRHNLDAALEILFAEPAQPHTAIATDQIGERLWMDMPKGGGEDAELRMFALHLMLSERSDLVWAGAGWVRRTPVDEEIRPRLQSPRLPTTIVVPADLPDATDDEEDETAQPIRTTQASTATESLDYQTWQENRRSSAIFTLQPSHYYELWLPLNEAMQQVFPPLDTQIAFHAYFGGEEQRFTALVDRAQERIVADQNMYDVFKQSQVYPGARLTISHRGGTTEYDIRTQPVSDEQRVIVRRLELVDGQIESFEDEEIIPYAVDGDVFVASARFEDLPALFRQADEAGNSIFGLMYNQCKTWWEENGRQPLDITAEQLWDAIHNAESGGRLTSRVTIDYELWRRLAFRRLSDGRYHFRPEQGERTRSWVHPTNQPQQQQIIEPMRSDTPLEPAPDPTELLSEQQPEVELALLAVLVALGLEGGSVDDIYPRLAEKMGFELPRTSPSERKPYILWHDDAYRALERLDYLGQIDILTPGVWAVNSVGRARLAAAGRLPAAPPPQTPPPAEEVPAELTASVAPTLWELVAGLRGRPLETPSGVYFTIHTMADDQLMLRDNRGYGHVVRRDALERAWEALVRSGTLSLSALQGQVQVSRHLGWIVGALPGVQHVRKNEEFRYLLYKKADKQQASPLATAPQEQIAPAPEVEDPENEPQHSPPPDEQQSSEPQPQTFADPFWQHIAGLLGYRLRFIQSREGFLIRAIDEKGIDIWVEENKRSYRIGRQNFANIYQRLREAPACTISLAGNDNKLYGTFGPYILAILATFPGMLITRNPISLFSYMHILGRHRNPNPNDSSQLLAHFQSFGATPWSHFESPILDCLRAAGNESRREEEIHPHLLSISGVPNVHTHRNRSGNQFAWWEECGYIALQSLQGQGLVELIDGEHWRITPAGRKPAAFTRPATRPLPPPPEETHDPTLIAPEDAEPTFERNRRGQLVAVDLLPKGPLFNTEATP